MKGKGEKIIIAAIGIFLIASGVTVYLKGDKLEEILKNNAVTSEICDLAQRKKLEAKIGRELDSRTLVKLIKNLPLERLQLADEILSDEELIEFLNIKYKSVENPDYNQASRIMRVTKGIQELSLLSPELKGYFEREYPQLGVNGNRNAVSMADIIRMRDRLVKLIPVGELKPIINELPNDKIVELNRILVSDPEILRVLESKKIGNYGNAEKTYTLAKGLYEMGNLDPRIALILNQLFPDFNYRKAALYGNLYLVDDKLESSYNEEFLKGNYTFKEPFVRLNPFGRTPLSALVRFKTDAKNPVVKVTVAGKDGMPNYSYIENYNKDKGLTIVGLYPRNKNLVTMTLTDGKKVLGKCSITIDTGYLNDALPAIYVEKRIPGGIQPGMNLAVYNTDKEGMSFIFDSMGNIRYVLETGEALRKVTIRRSENGNWIVSNDEDSFLMDILGRILGTMGTREPEEPVENKQRQYLMRNNNILTVTGFIDGAHPSALFSEMGLDSKQELFRARIFYDRDRRSDNSIERGERIQLYPEVVD